MGNREKAGPEPIPHSEHGEPGKRGAGFFWQVWGGWNSVHCQTLPNAKRSLALTDSVPAMATGDPSPQNLLLKPGRICAIRRKGLLPPASFRVCFFGLLASDLTTDSKSLFLPSYSKLEEDRRKHKTKGPQEESQGRGQNDIRGVQKMLDLVASGTGFLTHPSHTAQTDPTLTA